MAGTPTLGEALRALLKLRQRNLSDVARAVGLQRHVMMRYLSGDSVPPKVHLVAILGELSVSREDRGTFLSVHGGSYSVAATEFHHEGDRSAGDGSITAEMRALGREIRSLCAATGKTYRELGRCIGVNHTHVIRAAQGKRLLEFDYFVALTKVCGLRSTRRFVELAELYAAARRSTRRGTKDNSE